ncbi:MAG TPA: DUF1579 domain-containing protein [Candidatus Limnocylindria bacterium]|nr:DUF1579 domain-containing protein [Candidatus Limnocylindria bacterium]
MPDSSKSSSRLHFDALEGQWSGHETIYPSPWGPGGPAEGKWRIARDGSGLHLVFDYTERRADGTSFDAHSVAAIDPETGDWLLFLFDSYGFPPLQPARGRWEGNRLVLEKTTPRGVGRTVFEIGPDRFSYSVASSAHGAATFTPVMDGVYRRS